MRITRSIVINAPLEKVWNVAARDFDKVDTWSSGVYSSGSAASESPADESTMEGRFCVTSFGKCYELFEDYDEQRHTFTYAAQFEKMPPGVTRARNTWSVERISSSSSRFTMSANTELNLIPGTLMRIPMRFQIPRILDENLEELKYFVETGTPHPRKLAALQAAVPPASATSTV